MDNSDITWPISCIMLVILILGALSMIVYHFIIWIEFEKTVLYLFDINYAKYNYLVPFVFTYEGENAIIPLIITIMITILLVLLGKLGGINATMLIVAIEVFLTMLITYIGMWVAVICWILNLFGYTYSKWDYIIPLILVMIIHILLIVVAYMAYLIDKQRNHPSGF